MPTYEYRCDQCRKISQIICAVKSKPSTIQCQHCGSEPARAIVSKTSVVLSSKSKVERLDPKYDKMVDQAMSRDPVADPDRLLKQMDDPASGRSDD